MAYSHTIVNGVDVIDLDDSVDLYSTPELKKFCYELIKTDTKRIVFNLETLKYIDSSGLAMLVNLLYESKRYGVTLKIANMSKESSKTFSLTKMENNFEIFGTVEDAIRSFG